MRKIQQILNCLLSNALKFTAEGNVRVKVAAIDGEKESITLRIAVADSGIGISEKDMGKLFDLEASGYFYTRLQNPTSDAVAAKIAALEGGVGAMLTASGQAANFYAVFNICEAGDHFICSSNVYGGTFRILDKVFKNFDLNYVLVDTSSVE